MQGTKLVFGESVRFEGLTGGGGRSIIRNPADVAAWQIGGFVLEGLKYASSRGRSFFDN